MYYLLFFFYLILFCIGVRHVGFIKKAGFDKWTLLILFVIKITAGLFMGWIIANYLGGGDYWAANIHGKEEYILLKKDPYRFLTNLFDASYSDGYGGVFDSMNSFWHDLAGNCLYKLLAIFNIFSRGNYYINILFLNVIGFFGHIALFRVFSDVYQNRKWPLIVGCFLLPSTLYFSSGLHKDNLIFTFVCIFSYALYFSVTQSPSLKKTIWLVIAALIIFLIRNFVLVALIPASIGFCFANKKGNSWKPFLRIYVFLILSLIAIVVVFPNKNPLHIIVQKQQDFLALDRARTQLPMDTLKPSLTSLIESIPSAINHSFLRPYVWENSVPYLFIPGMEVLLYLLLILLALFLKPPVLRTFRPFILYGIVFSASLLLFVGLVVPNVGSIIRYRSLYLPFLLIPPMMRLYEIYIKNRI